MTVTPRRDSASTPNVLTGTDVAAGVAVAASAARVTMGLGAAWGVGAQADRRKRKEARSEKNFLTKQHHRDRGENQDEEQDGEPANGATARVEFGDLVERLGVDASQPEQQHRP